MCSGDGRIGRRDGSFANCNEGAEVSGGGGNSSRVLIHMIHYSPSAALKQLLTTLYACTIKIFHFSYLIGRLHVGFFNCLLL